MVEFPDVSLTALTNSHQEEIAPAIAANREIMGATNPADADPGTIRADFAASIEENVVHGSDGPDTAAAEIAFFFGEDGICPRTR